MHVGNRAVSNSIRGSCGRIGIRASFAAEPGCTVECAAGYLPIAAPAIGPQTTFYGVLATTPPAQAGAELAQRGCRVQRARAHRCARANSCGSAEGGHGGPRSLAARR